jgi:UDP-N-acetylmuramoylalanine--D-glutamate ligase
MKIAIAGYGLEGEENYAYWSRDPSNQLTIVDESLQPKHGLPEGDVATILGEGVFEKLDDFDLVIRTAGLAPYKIKTNGKIWSATNEFFAKCPAKIIGITGTKGKGTTASLIAAIFEAAGKKVWLVGNIGVSAIKILDQIQPDDVVVFEMSSFQLWDIERSPQTAVVLLIEPDHLNVHKGMDDYVHAKGNIRRFQTDDDICIYNPTNEYSRTIATSSDKGRALRYGVQDDGGAYVKDSNFMVDEQIICSVDSLQLIGRHNVENACAAISVAKQWGLDNTSIEKGLLNFKGLPHRLEFIRNVNGVDYYNDSFSSAPAATVAAVRSFANPEILILGGIDKGGDFNELAEALKQQPNLRDIIIIGEIREKLGDILRDAGVSANINISDAKTMKEIVDHAASRAQNGDVVILSPACASFDMFRDFYDRGEQFRNVVQGL